MHTARRDTLGLSDDIQPTWTRNCEDHERIIGGGNGLKNLLNSLTDSSGLLFVQTAGEASHSRSTENIKTSMPYAHLCYIYFDTLTLPTVMKFANGNGKFTRRTGMF